MSALAALARFARPGPRTPAPGGHRCELCSAEAGAEHPHVVDLAGRKVCCACPTCARLFAQPGAGGRFRAIPDRVLADPAFTLSEAEWSALEIPVRLAFFFLNSALGRWVAVYPSPAGAMESALPLEAWGPIARRPLAAAAEPDVEALLVHSRPGDGRPGTVGGGPLECLLVPIDRCYELVGRMRLAWKGFDGGADARREIDALFAALRARARPPPATGGPR